jgi:hypothetical protein
MELLKTTKNGTTYYMLKDGRLGAIYPETGYARVSYSMKNFLKPEYREAQIKRNLAAVANDTIGKMMKYQINPVRMVTEFREINLPLYYKFFDREIHYNGQPWRKAYYKMESKERIKYPGDFGKLYNLLLAFETKNCTTNV